MIEKIDLSEVTERQDKIFSGDPMSRLSLMKKLNEVIDAVNRIPQWCYTDAKIDVAEGNIGTITTCTCGSHRRGESTGGWCCPVHGHNS